jgi:hypothetical protein
MKSTVTAVVILVWNRFGMRNFLIVATTLVVYVGNNVAMQISLIS